MNEARLAAWRDRRRDPLAFTLEISDPDTGRPVARRYQLPERPARAWALAYLSEEPADLLLDLLEEEDADELWEEATDPDSDVDVALLHTIGRALLARAAGRPWWQAGRLLATLVAEWATLDALAVDRGLGDPLDWPLERLCNWIWLRITKGKDENELARIEAAILAPPPGVDPADEEDEEEEAAGWFEAMAAVGGGVADESGVARG